MAAIKFAQTAFHLGVSRDAFQISGIVQVEQCAVNSLSRRAECALDKELESFQQTL